MNILRTIFISILLGWSSPALADAVGFGGGVPRLLSQNKSVTLQHVVMHVYVSKYLIKTDCCCTFVNNGPACKVRIGTVDTVDSATPMNDEPNKPPQGCFLSYKSYVNDKPVKTEAIRGNQPLDAYGVWHVKDVAFAAHETKTILDNYTHPPGFGGDSESYGTNTIGPVLDTTSSLDLHGEIKKADIFVIFDQDVLLQPLRAVSGNTLPNADKQFDPAFDHALEQALTVHGTFVYSASKAPKISGQTVHFEFNDLLPSQKDNIFLFYGHMKPSEAGQYVETLGQKSQQKPSIQ